MDEIEISSLVDKVDRKQMVLPEMQRRYVWRSTQVRDLFDSLYRGYPVGSILVWERPNADVEGRNLDVGENAGATRTDVTELLLDGQQRLTSLTAILKDKDLIVRGRRSSIDIMFNVLHPDIDGDSVLDLENDGDDDETEEEESDALDFAKKTFVVGMAKLRNQLNWISLREAFKESETNIWRRTVQGLHLSLESAEADAILQRIIRLKKIASIKIPIVKLDRTMDYRVVTDVFCRVNSAGSRLKGSDLALAQITSRWAGSLKKFESFQQKWAKDQQLHFDLGFVVRALVVFVTGQCKFKTISSITVDQYEKGWEDAVEALEWAFDLMKGTWGISSFSLLSAPALIITLAYYLKRRKDLNAEIAESEMMALHHWLLVASICGHYSKGSSESIMDQDLTAIRDGADVSQLEQTFAKQGWMGAVSEDDIKGKFHGSAYFGLMYLAMYEDGAKDWKLHTRIALGNSGSVLKVQFHHICPDAQLKAFGGYDASEINEIANLAFISGHTNRRISDTLPEVYLPRVSEEDRVAQCVPLDVGLYPLANYRNFLAARRKLLVQKLNGYLSRFLPQRVA